jgi:hypothetical protein
LNRMHKLDHGGDDEFWTNQVDYHARLDDE